MVVLDNDFISSVKLNYPKSANKIIDAYEFAASAHENIKRKSGEPYIVHPLAVAKILIDNDMDYATIIAGLLHDVVEDTPYTIEDMKKKFGSTVAKLVWSTATKVCRYKRNLATTNVKCAHSKSNATGAR